MTLFLLPLARYIQFCILLLILLTSLLYANDERYGEQSPKPPVRTTHVSSTGSDDVDGLWIIAGQDGIIYAKGDSLTGFPRPTYYPTSKLVQPLWAYDLLKEDRLEMAWYVDGLIMFVNKHSKNIIAIEPKSGKTRFSIPMKSARNSFNNYWVTQGSQDGHINVCIDNSILTVDSVTGQILHVTTCQRDVRIAPISIGNDYVFVPSYRGYSLARINPDGEKLWVRQLPGYLMTHPSVNGSILIAQTRKSSYGGQTTIAVELEKGTLLWEKKVDAYGCGVVFTNDGKYSVEGDMWLGPDVKKGRLVCRQPQTGNVLWTYYKSGTTMSHAPLFDSTTNQIYAVLDDGTVVCVNADKGTVLWETPLPSKPLTLSSSSYDPYHSCLSLSSGLLAVTDSIFTLYLIDVDNGRIQERIVLTENIIENRKKAGQVNLATAPWIIGDLLIVASDHGIRAYSFPIEKGARAKS